MAFKLFNKKTVFVLCVVNNNSVTKIHNITYTTYSYCLKVVNKFKVMGLVNIKVDGRQRIISITSKGKEVRQCLYNILGGIADGYR